MIVSCTEIQMKPDVPHRAFMVEATNNESLHDILRLCGNVPKPDSDRGGNWTGWKCKEIAMTPHGGSEFFFRVDFKYTPPPVFVAEESDEPQFPPYNGPVGKQPDGSFILTPRCWSLLSEALMWREYELNKMRVLTFLSAIKEFDKALHEDTGMDMASYT